MRVRQARAEAKAAKQQAALEAKRPPGWRMRPWPPTRWTPNAGERKERKALSKAEAKAKRDARYAARKARN